MYIREGKRFNIYAQATIDGVTYPNFEDAAIREMVGITWIDDPVEPADFSYDTYYRNEIDVAPYVIFERKPQEEIDKQNQINTNNASLAYLTETDWYVTRFAETGVAIPADVKAARQAARDAIVKLPEVK